MTQEIDNKEVSVVKQQATKALGAAQALTITSAEDRAAATDLLSKMKTVAKLIKAQKETVTKPMMTALENARGLFKPIETNLSDGEALVKRKMLDWDAEQDRAAEMARQKLAARVEKGTMKPETAVAKMENIQSAPTTVAGRSGGQTQTRIVKKYRVVDESKIPREYLVPNMAAITEALKAGKEVPGAEVYEEKVISAR